MKDGIMKKTIKGLCPTSLSAFVLRAPLGTWDEFCEDAHRKKETQQRIFSDQRGICAYCEINMADPSTEYLPQDGVGDLPQNDFRVEHFHPKNDISEPHKNWALDWHNLLGVCCGGDERCVYPPERFAKNINGKSDTKNHHCDSKKGKKVLDDKILNPLDIPPFPCLWKSIDDFSRRCIYLQPANEACNSVDPGIDPSILSRAQRTIDELNLNCNLLAKFRWRTIDAINKRIRYYQRKGKKFDEAVKLVMKQTFDNTPNVDGVLPNWPPFFTTIRSYFGRIAEDRLHAINYQG